MNYFSRLREDGKYDILEGSPDEPGRVVTTLATEEEAGHYIDELHTVFNDLFNRITDLETNTSTGVTAAGKGDTMPWALKQQGDQTCVVNKQTGAVKKCYGTRDEAVKFLKALYVNQAAASMQAAIDDLNVDVVEPTSITINGATNPISTALKVVDAIQAHAELPGPPTSHFSNPNLTELQRWTTITEDGRVYGHSAGKDECHIGYMDRCVTIDDIADGIVAGCNWEYSMPGHVVAADGSKVATGPIPIKGGHADKSLDWIGALSHYDDPASVVADVVYGRDDFGIWFSGAVRPTATPEMIYALRASGVSLDARGIGQYLRYLTTCCVNTPGFNKADAKVAASGEVLSLVAAGGAPIPDPTLCDCEDCSEELDTIYASIVNHDIEELSSRIPDLPSALDYDLDSLYARTESHSAQ